MYSSNLKYEVSQYSTALVSANPATHIEELYCFPQLSSRTLETISTLWYSK